MNHAIGCRVQGVALQSTTRVQPRVSIRSVPKQSRRVVNQSMNEVAQVAFGLGDLVTGATFSIFLLSAIVGATSYYMYEAFTDKSLRDPFIDHED